MTYQQATDTLPPGSKWSSSFGYPGDGGYCEFWRTADGHEVDLVVDVGGHLIPIEIKLNATPHPGMVAGIAARRRIPGRAACRRVPASA